MPDEQDPRAAHPQPPFPEQEQRPPGKESDMDPRPDFGEDSYVGHDRLAGRAALITGGDSGIGRAVALAFAREGADVLISYLNEHSDADETVKLVEKEGRKALAVAGDISSERHCRDLVDRAVSELGGIDVLVNNAAYQMTYDSILEIPSEEIEFVFKTNIISMFYLCKAAIPHMKPGSTIINTASVEAFQPSPKLLHYASTKAAIVNFTKGLAQQLIEKGIRVNAVAPGPVWTPLIPMSFPGETSASFGETAPIKRPGQPAELAPAYVFLASAESSYLVGEVIGVTGGMPVP
ncbi:MAG TPA: SDR family oxidoreductase [Actinomycetota bacterium]|nr:SDR family oxidoreductase [Actinomycetota bacterium]